MPALHVEALRLPARRRHPADSRWWREWCFARMMWSHFWKRLLVMLGILALGATCFLAFDDRPHTLAEAAYFTWSLVFAEPPAPFPDRVALQALYFLIPVLGLTVIIEGIVDFALTLRERHRRERSWCATMAAAYTDHIVLVGLGRLGFLVFKLLRRLGEAVVVIERDANNEFLADVRRDGSPLLIGDARREAILEDANVRKAKSIILATDDDLANLEVALDARRLAHGIRVVLRMFDQHMADNVRDGFSIRMAMSQSAISAPMFAMSAIEKGIVGTFVVGDELVVMQRWVVHAAGPLVGKSVADLMSAYGFGVVELRHADGPGRLFPPPNTVLAEDDRLIVQGPLEALEALSRGGLRLT